MVAKYSMSAKVDRTLVRVGSTLLKRTKHFSLPNGFIRSFMWLGLSPICKSVDKLAEVGTSSN